MRSAGSRDRRCRLSCNPPEWPSGGRRSGRGDGIPSGAEARRRSLSIPFGNRSTIFNSNQPNGRQMQKRLEQTLTEYGHIPQSFGQYVVVRPEKATAAVDLFVPQQVDHQEYVLRLYSCNVHVVDTLQMSRVNGMRSMVFSSAPKFREFRSLIHHPILPSHYWLLLVRSEQTVN